MPSKIIYTILFLSLCSNIYCQQEIIHPEEVQDLIESIAQSEKYVPGHSQIIEDLNAYLAAPLNLNYASSEQLSRLYLLNPYQIHSLQKYIDQNGPLLSIYELPLVFGFSRDLAEKLQPFVTVQLEARQLKKSNQSWQDLLTKSRHQLYLRYGNMLEKQNGYMRLSDSIREVKPNQRYLGSSHKLYSRYGLKYRDRLRMGFVMEKDRGETFFKGKNNHGFDFNSFHLIVSQIKGVDRLAIGDYKVRYGQGLIAWSGFSLDKSPMVMQMMKNIHRIDPYTATNENRFFRGIALEKKVGPVDGSFFYSGKKIDANVTGYRSNGEPVVSSLLETGYHRLPREEMDEDVVNEKVWGGSLTLNQSGYRISLNGLYYHFDGWLQKGHAPYQRYAFSGNTHANMSVDYRFPLDRFYVFGEEAFSRGGGKAFLNGIYGQLASRVGMVLLHRQYDRHYHGHFSGAFAENTDNANESGIYVGLKLNVLSSLVFQGYMDAYRFPWYKYLVNAPSNGWDCMLNLEYQLDKHSTLYVRYTQSRDQKNGNDNHYPLTALADHIKRRIRGHLTCALNEQVTLKSRMEYVLLKSLASSDGVLIYQDISYKPFELPIRFDFRFALFDTKDYSSRIYAYEHDVLYSFSVPAYYGRGCRTYLNMRYQHGNTDWWLKLGRTMYTDRQVIGSGLDQINGNTKTKVNFQVRLKF